MKNRVTWIIALALAALVLADFLFVEPHHAIYLWDHVSGFYAVIGVVACIVVVLSSKALGAVWLQRPEDPDNDL
ncbi:hypothetical protein HQ520_14270 [bacterium]|nr:hypothetical protein [bacterium]